MIFYRSHAQTFATESLHVGLQDGVMAIAQAFEPEFVMAEHAHENTQVLQAASNTWAGVGLIMPQIDLINTLWLNNMQPKVFLLAANDDNATMWSRYGLVLTDVSAYQHECLQALNNVLT